MADSDRPEQDDLNKLMMEQRKIMDAGKKMGKYRTAQISVAAWEEFMLGCDPAWHEHKGNIKQEDD
jgi:hypothetical protein